MPQAIVTKWIPATNTKPARIKASTTGERSFTITVPMEDCNAHAFAARLLARQLRWTGEMVEGYTPEGSVFVLTYGPKFEI